MTDFNHGFTRMDTDARTNGNVQNR